MCSPSAPAQPTSVSQTTIPEYAKPYAEKMLGQAEALTDINQNPYEKYGGERLAESTQAQEAARTGVAGLTAPTQFSTATSLADKAGIAALGAGQYDPAGFAATNVSPYALQKFQMGGPERISGAQVTTDSFAAPGAAEQFMSPYMQNVVDIQKREALRDAERAQINQNLEAARRGAYGGSRQAVLAAERERNLGQRLSDIQATGSQAAYDAAQRAFEQEQNRRLQAQQATGQFGLTAAQANQAAAQQVAQQNLAANLGVQQLESQQGLEAQRLNQAANMEAQRLGEQSRQFSGQLGLQGAQAASQTAATLGQLGIAQQQQALERLKAQEAFGGLSRADKQAKLDLGYQDFLQQQRYPYAQLGFMSDILRGSANLAGTGGRAVYESPPSTLQQLTQAGLAGLSLYRGGA